MKPYTAYLFDADGTLIDTTEMIFQCFLHTCKKYGDITVTREEIFPHIGIPLRPQLEKALGPLTDSRADEIQQCHMDYQISIYEKYLKLFPQVYDTLENLKSNGRKLAVVTSRKAPTLMLYLEHTGILDFFDAVITPESTNHHKPHPEPAYEALKQLQCSPEAALFIGDSIFDMDCGSSAGTDTAFVSWSSADSSTLPTAPTWIINAMNELL